MTVINRYFLPIMILFVNSTFASPSLKDGQIVINPTGTTPLSAIFKLSKNFHKPITVFVKGKTREMTISHTFPAFYGKTLPIHGLYPNQVNTIIIKTPDEDQRVFTVKVPPVSIISKGAPIAGIEPEAGTPIKINTQIFGDELPAPDMRNQDLFFISLPNARSVIALDRKGDLRYLYQPKQGSPNLVRLKKEGSEILMCLIDNNKSLQTINMMGQITKTFKMPVHHDIVPYRDEQSFILANSKWGWEDLIFVIDKRGAIHKKLFIGDAIRNAASPKDRELLNKVIFDDHNPYILDGVEKRIDWAHANSLVYDPQKDLLYLSLRHHGVIAVEVSSWTMKWFMNADEIKISRGLKYGQIPEDSLFLKDIPSLASKRVQFPNPSDNPIGQHALFLRSNNSLMLFDNQAQGRTNPLGSRFVEYVLDHKTLEARIEQQFQTKEKNYARYVSDVDMVGDLSENPLIFFGYGKDRRIIELDPKGKMLFDMKIESPSVMYRIDKFPIYPYMDSNRVYSLDYADWENQK
ncbi:MAG: aryl-sulfate sulfotransferase [Brevinema sp.]